MYKLSPCDWGQQSSCVLPLALSLKFFPIVLSVLASWSPCSFRSSGFPEIAIHKIYQDVHVIHNKDPTQSCVERPADKGTFALMELGSRFLHMIWFWNEWLSVIAMVPGLGKMSLHSFLLFIIWAQQNTNTVLQHVYQCSVWLISQTVTMATTFRICLGLNNLAHFSGEGPLLSLVTSLSAQISY